MIKKFGVFCSICLEKSKPHLVWHEQEVFTFICYNCGTMETVSIKGGVLPKDTEEYDKIRENEKEKTKANIDLIIEKRLN